MVPKAGRKKRFACTNMIVRRAQPGNKEEENNTHRRYVTLLSTVDVMMPLVLKSNKLNI